MGKIEKEIWKDIPNYIGIYKISNLGRVKSYWRYKEGKIIKTHLQESNHINVFLKKDSRVKIFKIARLLYSVFIGVIPIGLEVDHVNRIADDNRLCNLRLANRQQQAANSTRQKTKTTSRFKGVFFDGYNRKKCWRAAVKVNQRGRYVGRYFTEEEAALAYNSAAKKYFGEYAALNQVE